MTKCMDHQRTSYSARVLCQRSGTKEKDETERRSPFYGSCLAFRCAPSWTRDPGRSGFPSVVSSSPASRSSLLTHRFSTHLSMMISEPVIIWNSAAPQHFVCLWFLFEGCHVDHPPHLAALQLTDHLLSHSSACGAPPAEALSESAIFSSVAPASLTLVLSQR